MSILSDKIRLNGTLLLFGCSKSFNTLASLNLMLEEFGFEFVEEIILDKGIKSIAGRISSKIKMLPPVSENIIVYRKNAKPFVKQLLRTKQKEYNLASKEIRVLMGFSENGGGNWTKYCGDTEFPLFPTEEHWNKLRNIFNIDIEYKNIKETYNGIFGLTNVWNDINFYIKNRKHPSEKPIKLMDRCINIFSDEGNTVVDVFSGSGVVPESCKKLNRIFLGIEKDVDYWNIGIERIK